jgi:hypothetical protein
MYKVKVVLINKDSLNVSKYVNKPNRFLIDNFEKVK